MRHRRIHDRITSADWQILVGDRHAGRSSGPPRLAIIKGMTTSITTLSAVTAVPAAPPAEALEHFRHLLRFETDCADVHRALDEGARDFVLLDVRSPEAFARGHVDGAVSLPLPAISAEALAACPADALLVTYCAGPHCNGADKAALRVARLGRRVKKMLGGVTGWLDEGYGLVPAPELHGAQP